MKPSMLLTGLLVLPLFAASAQEDKFTTGPWPAKIEGHVPVKPGEHPRLVFRKADVPELRRRATQTPEGRAIVARLRAILDGGEGMPSLFNTNPPVNTGARGPAELPETSFTLWHGAAFGLLYQITGDAKYADLGLQCVDKAFAGIPDRDERYGWTRPGGQLRAGPSVSAIALAYDLCYDGWKEADRIRVAQAIQNYESRPISDAAEGGIKLENLALHPRHHPQSNHWGMQVGGAVQAILAIRGDPGTDADRLARLLEGGKANLARSITEGHGVRGYYPEGHHTGRMTAHGIVPAFQALRLVEGEDWTAHSPAVQHLLTKWLVEVVRQNGRTETLMRDRYAYNGFQRGGMHSRDFAHGFGIALPAHLPAQKWFFNHVIQPGPEKDYDIVHYPQGAIYALANWPLAVEERNPDEVISRIYWDTLCGYIAARNGWSGQPDTDILVTAYQGGGRYGAYGAGQGGQTMVMGLGLRTGFPGGFHRSSTSYFRQARDGSILLSSIMIHTHLAVDYSKSSGAEAVIAMIGPGAGVERWALPEVLTHERTGATAVTRRIQAGAVEYHIMTLQRGAAPDLVADGDAVKIGGQTLGYNGKHLTLAVMGDGPPAFDPGGDRYESMIGKPIPAGKLFETPPPPTPEEKLEAVQEVMARHIERGGRYDRARLAIQAVLDDPEMVVVADEAWRVLRTLDFAEIQDLLAKKQLPRARAALEIFIGKHHGSAEEAKARQMLKDLDLDAMLEGF